MADRPYEVGDTIEDFTLPKLDGGMGNLTDYQGHAIVLVFIVTWSPYCKAQATFLEQELWHRFKDRGVQLIAISCGESGEVVRSFRDQYQWSFPLFLDLSNQLAVRFAPQTPNASPQTAIVNAHFVLDKQLKLSYKDFLDPQHFDARDPALIVAIEKLM